MKHSADLQTDWIKAQTELVTTVSECEAVEGAVMELRARETVLSQKRGRLRGDTEAQKREMKTLHLAIRYERAWERRGEEGLVGCWVGDGVD